MSELTQQLDKLYELQIEIADKYFGGVDCKNAREDATRFARIKIAICAGRQEGDISSGVELSDWTRALEFSEAGDWTPMKGEIVHCMRDVIWKTGGKGKLVPALALLAASLPTPSIPEGTA